MDEQQAISWIHNQLKFGIKPGLKRVEWLLNQLGNPEKKLKLIHVAGTNGKGSTVTYLRHLLQAHDYQVGTFTSPYIELFNERISINGQPISGEDLVKYVELIKPLCEQVGQTELGKPTEFEIITVIAFKYFLDKNVDYAIFEVGLGGRLDSTNVIEKPLLSIITSIGFDHTKILGETIEEITAEKSGIIKESVPVITNVTDPTAIEIIKETAKSNESQLFQINEDYSFKWIQSNEKGEHFTFVSEQISIDSINITMSGKHQIENATLALFSFIKLFELENKNYAIEKIKRGLKESFWIGRFEIIDNDPTIVLDGAHNVEAVETLIDTLNRRFRSEHIYIILSVVKNKPIDGIISKLKEHFRKIIIVPFDYFQSYGYDELKNISEKYNISLELSWKRAFDKLRSDLNDDDCIVITGSLYFVSEVRQDLIPRKATKK